MSKKVKEVIRLLQINGWNLVRTQGDLRIFRKIGETRSIPIAGKDSKDMPEGLYRAILRQAKLK